MLTYADFVVLTKIDMVSQAEREIILWKIKELNPTAKLFTVDGLTGYGAEGLADWLSCFSKETNFDDDVYATVCQAVFARIASEKKG